MHRFLKKVHDEKRIVNLPMDMIGQNPNQPRKYFDPQAMEELKNSIKEFGLIQPVTVRRVESSLWRARDGFVRVNSLVIKKSLR